MTFEDVPMFNTNEDLNTPGYTPELPGTKPPYGLEVLKPIAPDEYAVFTHNDALTHLWHASIARTVSPWGVLGAALAMTAAMVEPTVQTPPIIGGNGSLNLLVGLVAKSGIGKGSSTAVARDFLEFGGGVTDMFETFPLGTGQGIAEVFRPPAQSKKGKKDDKDEDAPPPIQRTRALFVAQEVDGVAANNQQRGSTLMPVMRKVFSGENPGNTNGSAETTRDIPDNSYRAAIICGIQPERSHSLLNESEIAGGTPQRWLWLPCEPYPLRERQADQRLVKPAQVNIPNDCLFPDVRAMVLPDHVWRHTKDMQIANVSGENEEVLDTHSNYTRIKVACLLAIMGGQTTVTDKDWDVSGLIMEKSASTRQRCFEALQSVEAQRIGRDAANSQRFKDAKEEEAMRGAKDSVIRNLKNHTELPLEGKGGLKQRARSTQRSYIESALQELVEDGHVHSRELSGGFDRTLYYLPKG